jgi:hypothetical protein
MQLINSFFDSFRPHRILPSSTIRIILCKKGECMSVVRRQLSEQQQSLRTSILVKERKQHAVGLCVCVYLEACILQWGGGGGGGEGGLKQLLPEVL